MSDILRWNDTARIMSLNRFPRNYNKK